MEIPVIWTGASTPPDPRPGEGLVSGVLLDLKAQVDLTRLGEALSERRLPKTARRRLVTAALARVAERSQTDLVTRLEELRQRGAVEDYRSYSVINRLWARGVRGDLVDLARHPAVARVEWETRSEAPVWAKSEAPASSRTSWALAAIGADLAHGHGLDGRGIVVGIIDSGASATHEQLRDGFLGAPRGWHDPAGKRETPEDGAFGHGTGVLSTAVGANVNGILLGVAPGARWSGCAALPEGHYNNALLTACADWMLNVAAPDVLINAWFLPEPGCDPSLRRIVDAWRAAEILPVFAVGNEGPERGRDRSPANYADLFPGGVPALSIGGLARHAGLYASSTPGPNSCDPGSLFPTLVAPAEDLIAALPLTTASYRQVGGTSFAAGLVAGAAAILLQADPDSSVTELERALYGGAVDLGAPGLDDVYGHGRLDIPGALAVLAEIRGARR